MHSLLPRIAITPGEPAGIGPDILVAAAQQRFNAEIVAIGSADLLQQRAHKLGITLRIEPFDATLPPAAHLPGTLKVHALALNCKVNAGSLDAKNSEYVLKTLNQAVELCLQNQCQALVTGPVHKAIINQAGFAFSGHTEYLAMRTQTPQPVMLLQTSGLRVALATTHLPLRAVSDAINADLLHRILTVIHHDLKNKMHIADPVIYVCGLNPHAGEGGHLGREEIEIISPVIDHFKDLGWQIHGPLAADTIFSPHNLKEADVFLAMYHDQGLPVLKFKGFNNAVNITLGLPFIRTSVDHGTAIELAGHGTANCDSLILAIETAIDMVHKSNLDKID